MNLGSKALRRTLVVMGMLSLSAGSIAAHAQNWYAGVGVGQADYDLINEEDTSLKLFAGYTFNPNVAFEAAYVDLGEAEVSGFGLSASASADGLEATVVGSLPVSPNVNLFGRVGFFMWDVEYKVSGLGSASEDGTDLTYGVGVHIGLNKQFAIRGEMQWYEVDDEDVDNLGVSLVYNF